MQGVWHAEKEKVKLLKDLVCALNLIFDVIVCYQLILSYAGRIM